MDELKKKILDASHLVWGRFDGDGTLENGWKFCGLVVPDQGQWHSYEKEGVTIEFQETTPADWFCWTMAAEILQVRDSAYWQHEKDKAVLHGELEENLGQMLTETLNYSQKFVNSLKRLAGMEVQQ